MGICYIVMVLCLIYVQVHGIPSECQNCGCCVPGAQTCIYNGYCNYGCLDGYRGDRCYIECQYINCKKCARNDGFNCSECKNGFYDNECGSSCAPNCERCQRQDGQCSSCVNGYWGKSCNNECGYHCKTCFRWGGCTECNTGYFGPKCEKYCGDHCANCNKETGCTACENGYYGTTCETQCGVNYCTSCTSPTQCTSCTDGRFGSTCLYKCIDDCVHGETCDQCLVGYYGNGCTQRCSLGCSDGCNRIDGACTCKSGWAGDKCDTCADKYFGDMCNEQCNTDIENTSESEKQTTLSAYLECGGLVVLVIIAILGMCWFRKRRLLLWSDESQKG
ncbi:TENX-like protein [Mya arenaria]|uniref:TENX-like protein n=1 Tax=Mya arenaria TaxID=6604 RepID=A0ABY7F7K5_MYAAR|nr:TENX-like protein [Mya arenaria]